MAEGLNGRKPPLTPLMALIEAALDQPQPTVTLKLALNGMLESRGHPDRLRPVVYDAAQPIPLTP